MAKTALGGIRIADWTIAAAGPSATMWLGAYGAEVIKIENRDGSVGRQQPTGPAYGVPVAGAKNLSTWFEGFNYNKKSITVDLKKEKGREIVYRLVKTADVFAHNQLPDTVEKLGMSYETLLKHNPQLIYAACSVFGSDGPRRLVPAYDAIGQAVSGTLMTSGSRGDPPTFASPGIGDFSAGFSLCSGIVMALLHRERTGEPQIVETSQLQACMNIINLAMLDQFLLRTEEQRQQDPNYGEPRTDRRENVRDPASGFYKCKDGREVIIGSQREKNWKAFCQAVGEPELADNPKFATPEKRLENRQELLTFLGQLFASKTLKEWEEKFQGADCSFSPVNRMRDIPHEPQVVANNYLYTFDHPVIGPCQYSGMPFALSQTPGTIRTAAPALGEHTDEVLLELGYPVEEVLQLHEKKIV